MSEEERARLLRLIGEEYAETLDRVDHWIEREVRHLGQVDEVERFAYLCEQLRRLPPETVGAAPGMAAVLILREAKAKRHEL
ncbi:hypothetical protein [Micromonospora sp. NPDC047730]|uniref:hypothetical protein n=1 Tax=Micromonospora sp. NPDC047730 TaxID=3364253 RepID=UPI003712D92E